jgi:hypothetical protein
LISEDIFLTANRTPPALFQPARSINRKTVTINIQSISPALYITYKGTNTGQMIDQKKFELIKEKYGCYSSWAVWADAGERPKDNIGDLSVFDIKNNPGLFQQLNPNIILVGLNTSRGSIKAQLGNFHDPRHEGMDFKIRYALKNSPFWGAYITDIIKNVNQKECGKVMSYLKTHKQVEKDNARFFREEICDLGVHNPIIIALGEDTYTILNRNFQSEYTIKKIPHYSAFSSKEKYREQVSHILQYG